jgi:hypothetical protein
MLAVIGLALLLCSPTSAAADPVPLATVGGADNLIGGFDGVGNSDADEEDFLFDYLVTQGYNAADLTYQKIDVSGELSFNPVIDNPTLWAIDFGAYGVTNPLVFMVKLGNAESDHYLYENVASLQYGVVDLSEIVAAQGNITIESISHTGTASGPVNVPEPASLSLFGLGMVSVGAIRRRTRT